MYICLVLTGRLVTIVLIFEKGTCKYIMKLIPDMKDIA